MYFDKIKEILEENLDIAGDQVSMDSTMEQLGVDSLDLVELVCELEDELDLDLGQPENISTIADLILYIEELVEN